MKRQIFIILINFLAFSLLSGENLFLPDSQAPFILNSAEGIYSIIPSEREWKQSLMLESQGNGGNVQLAAMNIPSFSLEGSRLEIWIKVKNLEALRDLWIFAASDNRFENRIVYMISEDRTQLMEGVWTKISLPQSAGRMWGTPDLKDLRYFQIWMNDKGSAPASLEIGPINLENNLFTGAAVLTFDDGWETQYTRAAPIMQEYGFAGTAYVIPANVGKDGFMSLDQIINLKDEYRWSIGAHDLKRLDFLNVDELKNIFEKNKPFFNNLSIDRPDFSYPNGKMSPALIETLPQYYSSGRSIIEYSESQPPGDPYRLRTINIVPGISRELIQSRLAEAQLNGELAILIFHKITENKEYETEISEEEFRFICQMISDSGIEVKTMSELSSRWQEMYPAPSDLDEIPIFQQPEDLEKSFSQVDADIAYSPDKAGKPEETEGIHVDFSLDWKLVLGKRSDNGDPQYYNQLEDLYLYFQVPLPENTRVYSAIGFSQVNFSDLSRLRDNVDTDVSGEFPIPISLKHIYMQHRINNFLSINAGYYNPDPVNKWLQVTRSAGIEPSFGENMTPTTLWIQGTGEFIGIHRQWGVQLAFSPDLIGKDGSLTYQEELGVPNLFGSIWYEKENLKNELAAAINGDALKIVYGAGYDLTLDHSFLHFSLGVKYQTSGTYSTYPQWDDLDSLRISTGTSWVSQLGPFTISPGAAYRITLNNQGNTTHTAGLDLGLNYNIFEWYAALSCYDLLAPAWQVNTGLETGLILDFKGVEYMAGYTMAGYNSLSGLYNNKDWNEGGINGFFMRIKATYW